MKAKQKKKIAAAVSLVVVLGAGAWMAFGNFQESLVYFYTPTEVLEQSKELSGRKIRLAGQVEMGSLQKAGDLNLSFRVTDGTNAVPVRFRGVTPDLFAEGQMAIAEGRVKPAAVGAEFEAEQIMAKHSEDYDPEQMKYPHMNKKPEKW